MRDVILDRSIPITIYDFISNTGHCRRRYTRFTQLCICSRITLKIHGRVLWLKPVTTDGFISNTGHCRRRYTRFTQLCKCPRNTLKIHGRVLWPKPVTTDDFISNTGHCWRRYTRFTLLCKCPRITLKIHCHVLWPKPVTTDGFIFASHYYWGAGRPKYVSGTTPTAVLCPPSGFQVRLHVGSRSDPIQSLNQYRINIWLYDTFLHNRIWYFVLSLLCEYTESNI